MTSLVSPHPKGVSANSLFGPSYRRESYIVITVLPAAAIVLFILGSSTLSIGSYAWWGLWCIVLSLALVLAALYREVRYGKS